MDQGRVSRVEKRSAEAQAIKVLRESIVSGAIEPGSRLREIELGEDMHVSRTTVRTALHQLMGEGLVSLVPYTGWAVASFDEEDIWELYTLRSSIERLASRLVAERINATQAAQLRSALDELTGYARAENREKIAEADFRLHKTIVGMTGHSRLQAQYRLLEQQIRLYIRSSDALTDTAEEIVAQHRPIVEAILVGNAGLAAELSERHNLTEGAKLYRHMSGRDPATNPSAGS